MLSEWLQYQGKAGFFNWIFKMVFLEILASANKLGFAQAVTFDNEKAITVLWYAVTNAYIPLKPYLKDIYRVIYLILGSTW